ncbi:MAG: M20 family metallo-hydrolase [Firmicutes bacterium]|nr:M20 family metallo-hydrolase [Bacillota bacterium]
MKINKDRLLEMLHDLKEFTDTPGNGVTRFSFGIQDATAREYILERAVEAGCSVDIDALQNIRIGLKTNSPDKDIVMAGSHIDTVRHGGWLDGIYGVCGALEVMLTLAEYVDAALAGDKSVLSLDDLKANYEMVIFSEEEGSNFGSTMTGSKFVTGFYKEEDLGKLRDDKGKTLRQRLIELPVTDEEDEDSLDVYSMDYFDSGEILWDFNEIKTMLELHIEQGPVLDSEGLSIGIVDAIYGMRVIEVTLTGVGNHAGATPMGIRYDALCTAAECVLAAEEIVKSDEDERIVATIGKLSVFPDCSNVIPQEVKFTVEVRDKDEAKINEYMDSIIERIYNIASARRVGCVINEHSKSSPLYLTKSLRNDMEKLAKNKGLAYKVMDSGAVHDACMIANFVDTGMIFVPSIDGRSHVPEENTNEKDLITGVQFLLDVVLNEMKTEV